METDASYWVLHQWLFDAYVAGMKTGGLSYMPRPIAMTCLFGPNWREEEEKIALDYARKNPEEAAFLAKVLGGKRFGD